MSSLDIIADQAGMWDESVAAVTSGLNGLGAGTLAETAQKASDALALFAGATQMLTAVVGVMEVVNGVQATQAAAEVAAKSVNPLTWPMVVAGLGAATVVGTFAFGITRNYVLKANLANPSEASAVAMTAEVLA